MEVFIALLIFGAVVAAVTAANRSAQRVNDAWAEAAARLGLDFQPGSTFRRRGIRGERGAIRIELTEKSGGNNNTVRRWRLSYPSTPFSMTLTVETPGKKLLKAFGAQDFEIGDPAFDSRFMVAGSDHAAIVRFLDADRRAVLLGAAERMSGIKITNSDISWQTNARYKTSSGLLEDAKVLLRTAAVMAADTELPPPHPARPSFWPAEPVSEVVENRRAGGDPWVASHDLPTVESAPGRPRVVQPDVASPALAPAPAESADPELPGQPEAARREHAKSISAGGLVRLEDLIEDILGTRRLSFEANKLVAEKYEGRTLMVVGPVRSVRRVDRDFDFRDQGAGVRVEATVGEVTGTRVGAGAVIAIAHLPEGTSVPSRGDEILISGTILKVETLRRAIYLVDAQMD